MRHFNYVRPASLAHALEVLAREPDAQILAGGTNLVDLMKYDVSRPSTLVDINGLPLNAVIEDAQGGLKVGALVTNSDVAYNQLVTERYPVLASAILAGASAQLRNVATVGGNLLQRTRCSYFYDLATPCNKREPHSGCSAIGGLNRNHAIIGTSLQCIATHPSDMCVALAALSAVVNVEGPRGCRAIPFADFHRLPDEDPAQDTSIMRDEIVLSVNIPSIAPTPNYSYLKIRDRLSYAFALVSVASVLHVQDGKIAAARVAVGGIAAKAWRRVEAEASIIGLPPDRPTFISFASALLRDASGHGGNDFKLELAHRAIVRSLSQARAGTPQSQSDKRVR